MAAGCFVVVEGGEGSGKSTQCRLLVERVRALSASGDAEVIETFEPGATARGAALRAVLLDDHSPLDPRAELLLMVADRAQHVAEVVAPALARGAVVVCDRFTPSTLVYQGVARGLGVDVAEAADALATAGVAPDAVVVLDVDEHVAAERRPVPGDRLEAAGAEFHARVRQAYRELAPSRGWMVVDGAAAPDAVARTVWAAVAPAVERVVRR